jgi:hypothetical protein
MATTYTVRFQSWDHLRAYCEDLARVRSMRAADFGQDANQAEPYWLTVVSDPSVLQASREEQERWKACGRLRYN